jgi:hypothetical protein
MKRPLVPAQYYIVDDTGHAVPFEFTISES